MPLLSSQLIDAAEFFVSVEIRASRRAVMDDMALPADLMVSE
jgi:hypothetical protein